MWIYYELLTDTEPAQIAQLRREVESGRRHPMEAKRELAKMIVRDFHSADAAEQAAAEFARVFREGQTAKDAPTATTSQQSVHLPKLKVEYGLAPSGTEASRLIKQGAVDINGKPFLELKIELEPDVEYTVKVGKKGKFLRLSYKKP